MRISNSLAEICGLNTTRLYGRLSTAFSRIAGLTRYDISMKQNAHVRSMRTKYRLTNWQNFCDELSHIVVLIRDHDFRARLFIFSLRSVLHDDVLSRAGGLGVVAIMESSVAVLSSMTAQLGIVPMRCSSTFNSSSEELIFVRSRYSSSAHDAREAPTHRRTVSPNVLRRFVFCALAALPALALDAERRAAFAQDNGADPNVSKSQSARGPTLVVGEIGPKRAGEPLALEISARDLRTGGFVVINGLAKGARLAVGTQLGDSSWWVPAADLERVVVQPPPHFAGTMDLTVELRLADTKLSDKKSLRLEWVPVVSLDANEIAALLKRGNELLTSGDLAAAQLVLRRAAEAGSAQAAMILAGTYDPALIEKLGAHGFTPNVTLAREWYEKAKQLGSIEAARRLELMAIKRD